jgi:hypothetical protein
MQRQLWAERMNVYSSFGGALTEARRGEYEWWNRCNEAPDSPACIDARIEAYRLRGLAAHALFRVQLVASNQAMVDVARHAYELTRGIHNATTKKELWIAGDRARERLDHFLMLASLDIQGNDTHQALTASGPHADQVASGTDARAGDRGTDLPSPEP